MYVSIASTGKDFGANILIFPNVVEKCELNQFTEHKRTVDFRKLQNHLTVEPVIIFILHVVAIEASRSFLVTSNGLRSCVAPNANERLIQVRLLSLSRWLGQLMAAMINSQRSHKSP